MRCVSYTRTVSNKASMSGLITESIMEQNARIQDFAKAHGWKIEKKYSDRKKDENEETAFLEMKADGIARRFDCVVIDSMDLCGKRVSMAVDLFSLVFLPAGIHFAVVEDGVVSSEMPTEEAQEYLERKRDASRYARSSVGLRKSCEMRQYPKYGYVYAGDSMELVINEKEAAVIREVFQLADKKTRLVDIVKIMEERKVESPHHYAGSQGDMWSVGKVRTILENQLYIGEWKRTIDGKKVIVPCPAIVDKAVFESVQKEREKHKKPKSSKICSEAIFLQLITDSGTGAPINLYTHQSKKIKIYRMGYPKPPEADYDKLWITYEEVERQVREQLAMEQRKAEYALQMIESEIGLAEKEKRIGKVRMKMQDVLAQMMEVEAERHTRHRDVDFDVDDLDDRFSDLDEQMYKLERKAAGIEQVFSEKNPWISAFTGLDLNAELDRKTVRKCIERIEIFEFETVTVYFSEQEWFY